jgi:hypothetical protein
MLTLEQASIIVDKALKKGRELGITCAGLAADTGDPA